MATIEERLDKIEKMLYNKLDSDFSLPDRFNEHTHNGLDSKKISFSQLRITPLEKVDAPSGGMTVDSQARTAINSIITRLEDTGLIKEN